MAHMKRVSLVTGLAVAAAFGSILPAQANLVDSDVTLTPDSISSDFGTNLVLSPEKQPATVNAQSIKLAAETELLDQPATADPSMELSAEEAPSADLSADMTEVDAVETEAAVPEMVPLDGVSTSADELLGVPTEAANGDEDLLPALDADDSQSEPINIAQSTRAAYRGITPAYIGVGGNLGIGDNESAVSDFGFAVLSKISLGPRFALRPGVIIAEDRTSFTVPLTYNFNVYEAKGFRFQPFAGVGADIATDGDVGLLLDAGVDVPISRDFTLNATTNFRITDGFGFGLVLGVGYNFPWVFE